MNKRKFITKSRFMLAIECPTKLYYTGKSEEYSNQKDQNEFHNKWTGGFNFAGEREKSEMQLCFGKDYESKNFLNNEKFYQAHSDLYGPLIEHLT